MDIWQATDHELEFFHRELDSFVPDRIFDAHVHLYDTAHLPEEDILDLMRQGPDVVGADVFLRFIDGITPGRKTSALCFPYPRPNADFEKIHEFLADEVAKMPGSKGQMLIKPSLDPEYVRETVRAKGFVGLKPYLIFSGHEGGDRGAAPIESFLPEEHVKIAHEEGLTVTLHISKLRALADPDNQATIRRYAETYPDMRLILAHSGRGFNPNHTAEGIHTLAGLTNVWFDTGVIQDAGAFEAIINTMGHTRLLWASDFPVSQDRGRCVAIGDDWVWVRPEMLPKLSTHVTPVRAVMMGYESLRALKHAATNLRLTDSQIEDIFYGNAAALYDLP